MTHPINLHHHDDIYYLVLCAILQHNMMVEARLEDGEKESSAMYNTVELTATESGNVDCGHSLLDEDNIAELEINRSMQQQLRFEISHKRWSTLYDCKGALKLKSAMMRHLFKQKFSADAMTTAYDMTDSYNPLSCQDLIKLALITIKKLMNNRNKLTIVLSQFYQLSPSQCIFPCVVLLIWALVGNQYQPFCPHSFDVP